MSLVIKVDARRIRKNNTILRIKNNQSFEHKVVTITERKTGDTYYSYKIRYITYEDGTSTEISLSPASIGGWIIMKLKLSNYLQVLFIPLLLNATDKYKHYDYLRLGVLIIVPIVLLMMIFKS